MPRTLRRPDQVRIRTDSPEIRISIPVPTSYGSIPRKGFPPDQVLRFDDAKGQLEYKQP